MKFLVDECLPARLAAMLSAAGHNAQHVVVAGLGGAPDEEVMAKAAADGRVLVSADTDFGELLANSAAAGPSVVPFRRETRRPEDVADVLMTNLPEIEEDLNVGALVVITDKRIRIRSLPM